MRADPRASRSSPRSASSSSTPPRTTSRTSCSSPSCSRPSSCPPCTRKRPGDAARQLAEFTPRLPRALHAPGDQVQRQHHRRLAVHASRTTSSTTSPTCSGATARSSKQYKLHVTPSERRWWGVQPGDRLEVFDTDRGKIAILICYDIEFPELARIAAAQGGADPVRALQHRRPRTATCACATAPRRAASRTTSTWPISGCVGNLPFVDNADIHYAQSGIFTPSDVSFARDGIAAECTPNIETLVDPRRRPRAPAPPPRHGHGPELDRPPRRPLPRALRGGAGGAAGDLRRRYGVRTTSPRFARWFGAAGACRRIVEMLS